jgi:hypothetical protein
MRNRNGGSLSNTWSVFGSSLKNRPALQNGWVDYAPEVNSYAIYYQEAFDHVHLEGLIKSGTTANNTILFSLPSGFKPPIDRFYNCANDQGTVTEIAIRQNGDVIIWKNGSSGFISLNQIDFSTSLLV